MVSLQALGSDVTSMTIKGHFHCNMSQLGAIGTLRDGSTISLDSPLLLGSCIFGVLSTIFCAVLKPTRAGAAT